MKDPERTCSAALDSGGCYAQVRTMRVPLLTLLAAASFLEGCASPGSGGASAQAVDLTKERWFPPVTRQQSFSCSQQAGLYYLFTAEWNRAVGRDAAAPQRRFSPYFAYSLLAGEESGRSHVVDGWILAQQLGVPAETDCPGYSRTLMHGYDRYLRAMQHRAESWEVLPVTTLTDVHRVERLLADGHPVACDFQIKGAVLRPLPEPWKPLPKDGSVRVPGSYMSSPAPSVFVKEWGRTGPGHAMVYAGYNRDFSFDANGDGKITTDADINGDGAVTLADCERGAFLVVNPWGGGWGDKGRAWVPWRLHATTVWPRARSVATVKVAPQQHPGLTLKLRLRAADRQNVLITVRRGSRTVQPWMFSHAPVTGGGNTVWEAFTTLRSPGPHLSAGALAAPDGGPLETGHDISALGSAEGCTLEIRPAGRGALSGQLAGASFIEHDSSGGIVRQMPVQGLPVNLPAGGGVWSGP